MRVKRLWIQKYQQYNNQEVIFDDFSNGSRFQKEIFGNMNIFLFSGENGSGKTTILSFISYIFRYIQRYRERMTSDYTISYDIMIGNKVASITLKKQKKDVYIEIDGALYYIKEYKIGNNRGYYSNPNIEKIKQVTYDEIKKYLPTKVYVLGFDNAYKKLFYSPNYIGDRLVEYRDISVSYGTTSRGNNISAGIAYFYYKILNNTQLRRILKSWGLELSSYVDIYVNNVSYAITDNKDETDDVVAFREKYRIKAPDFEGNLLYDASEIEKYLEDIDSEYNDRFRIADYLKTKKRYDILGELIDKRIIYINEFYINKGGRAISIKDMSTGEKAFLFNLFAVCSNLKENSIIIWEEPETHFNMKWSKNLIPFLVELAREKNIQWLLSSHSAYMIKNLFQNQIIRLNGMNLQRPNFNTFLANDTEIYKRLFADEENNLFEKKVIQYIKNGSNNIKNEMLDVLGESYLKFMIYKSLEK